MRQQVSALKTVSELSVAYRNAQNVQSNHTQVHDPTTMKIGKTGRALLYSALRLGLIGVTWPGSRQNVDAEASIVLCLSGKSGSFLQSISSTRHFGRRWSR